MHKEGLHCQCVDTHDACCDCTGHIGEDGEFRVYCQHCNTEADLGSYVANHMMCCNEPLDDDVGGGECGRVLCETCADDPATDCSEIVRAEA